MNDTIEIFKNLGYGVYFYFLFLKFFILVFFIISILSTVLIIINYIGGGLNKLGTTNFII